jgi:hypothetical protein
LEIKERKRKRRDWLNKGGEQKGRKRRKSEEGGKKEGKSGQEKRKPRLKGFQAWPHQFSVFRNALESPEEILQRQTVRLL